jgi:hypothetical protein
MVMCLSLCVEIRGSSTLANDSARRSATTSPRPADSMTGRTSSPLPE